MSRAGSRSITSSVAAPKWRTIRSAVRGPIPGIAPPPRYLAIPSGVCGGRVLTLSALNCGPYTGCSPHTPDAVTCSPAVTCPAVPITVAAAAAASSGWTCRTQYPVSWSWKTTRSTTPVSSSAMPAPVRPCEATKWRAGRVPSR